MIDLGLAAPTVDDVGEVTAEASADAVGLIEGLLANEVRDLVGQIVEEIVVVVDEAGGVWGLELSLDPKIQLFVLAQAATLVFFAAAARAWLITRDFGHGGRPLSSR